MTEQTNQQPQPSGDGKGGIGDILGQAFSQRQFSSAIKELVHPGKDVIDLLMRTQILDVNEARDLALTLAKCDEFNMEKEKKLLLYMLAARTSINGLARSELLQAITGFYYPPKRMRVGLPFKRPESSEEVSQNELR